MLWINAWPLGDLALLLDANSICYYKTVRLICNRFMSPFLCVFVVFLSSLSLGVFLFFDILWARLLLRRVLCIPCVCFLMKTLPRRSLNGELKWSDGWIKSDTERMNPIKNALLAPCESTYYASWAPIPCLQWFSYIHSIHIETIKTIVCFIAFNWLFLGQEISNSTTIIVFLAFLGGFFHLVSPTLWPD